MFHMERGKIPFGGKLQYNFFINVDGDGDNNKLVMVNSFNIEELSAKYNEKSQVYTHSVGLLLKRGVGTQEEIVYKNGKTKVVKTKVESPIIEQTQEDIDIVEEYFALNNEKQRDMVIIIYDTVTKEVRGIDTKKRFSEIGSGLKKLNIRQIQKTMSQTEKIANLKQFYEQ